MEAWVQAKSRAMEGGASRAGGAGGHALGPFKVICLGLEA